MASRYDSPFVQVWVAAYDKLSSSDKQQINTLRLACLYQVESLSPQEVVERIAYRWEVGDTIEEICYFFFQRYQVQLWKVPFYQQYVPPDEEGFFK